MNKRLLKKIRWIPVLGILACSDIKAPDPVYLSPNDIVYQLKFTTKAAMVENYDTITLKVIATFADSSQVQISPELIRWRSIDPSIAAVDSAGKVKASEASFSSTSIIALYTHKGITKGDTIPVYVTSTRLDADEVRIKSIDSTVVGAVALNGTPTVRIDLYKEGALLKEGVQVPVVIPDGVIVSQVPVPSFPGMFWSKLINNKGILGKFYVHASLNLYGNEVRDSVEFTGAYPASNNLPSIIQNMEGGVSAPTMKPSDPVKYIQPCAIVKFLLLLPLTIKPVDIVFSDSLQSGSETCAPISNADVNPGGSSVRANQVWGNVTGLIGPGLVIVVRRSPTVGEVSYYLRDAITKDSLPVSGRYIQK